MSVLLAASSDERAMVVLKILGVLAVWAVGLALMFGALVFIAPLLEFVLKKHIAVTCTSSIVLLSVSSAA